jgi:hypothetical protein
MRYALALLLLFSSARTESQASAVQRGVVIRPESVTVGDPFRVVVRIRAPLGTVLEFPAAPDTGLDVEPLDPVSVVAGTDTTVVEQTATYRLAAWDTGRLPIRFPDILARGNDGVRRVAVGRDLAITVVSVLPADTALRVPKPVRAVFEFGVPWWFWLVVALVAAVLGALFWWWWRRRPRAPAKALDPYEEAMLEFARIDSLGLLTAGEVGHHLALHADVLRTWLSRTVPAARQSLTTSELAVAMRGEGSVPLPRVLRVLHEIDLVKFARLRVSEAVAREAAGECRAIVDAMHAARTAAALPRAA